jgi:hypothetical protein
VIRHVASLEWAFSPKAKGVTLDKQYAPSCLTLLSLHSAGSQSPSKRFDHIAESTLGSPWPLSSPACKELKQPHRYRTQKLHYGRIAVNPSRVLMQPISNSVSPANWMPTSVILGWALDPEAEHTEKVTEAYTRCLHATITALMASYSKQSSLLNIHHTTNFHRNPPSIDSPHPPRMRAMCHKTHVGALSGE